MSGSSSQSYAVIATVAGTYFGVAALVGEVVNIVLWDGTDAWKPPAGTEVRLNTSGALKIGQVTTV